MNKEIKLFPAQEKGEKVLLVIRRHWFTYAFFWFLSLILASPLIVSFFMIPPRIELINENLVSLIILIESCYTLLVLSLLLYGFIDFYLDIYIITDRRIVDIKQNGYFNRSISELNFHQIQDVKASVKGIFPTIIHYGDVFIQTAGERENFFFKDVPHPYRVSKLILDLHETALDDKEGIAKVIPANLQEKNNYSMQDFNEGFAQDQSEGEKNIVENKAQETKPKDMKKEIEPDNKESLQSAMPKNSEQDTHQLQEGKPTKL